MAHKKKATLTKAILKVLILIPTILGLCRNVWALVCHETRTVSSSIIKLIILAIVSGILVASTWLCVLGLFAYYLMTMHVSYACILELVILINLIVLGLTAILILQAKKYLFFPQTRELLKNMLPLSDE